MKALIFLFATLLLLSCKGTSENKSSGNSGSETDSQGKSASTDSDPDRTISTRKIRRYDSIIIETSMGTIEANLHYDTAPVTVENFLNYVDKWHYDNTIFHRVIEDFMIQGGGFEIKEEVPTKKETGVGILCESAKTRSNLRGTLAMARTADPHSATAQFFINVVDNERLDHPESDSGFGYAVFGEVTKGMNIVDQIKAVPVGVADMNSPDPDGHLVTKPLPNAPVEPVLIESIRRTPKS